MQIDRNLMTFLAGESVAQSTMGGGISDARVKMETEDKGLKIEIFTPTLGIEDYDIEIKNQFLQVYTLYGKSLIAEIEQKDVRLPIMTKSVLLPAVVDANQIEAVFEEGVLRVFLPFKDKEELAARKVDIKEL